MATRDRVAEEKAHAKHDRAAQRALERQLAWEEHLLEQLHLTRNLFFYKGDKLMAMREIRVKVIEGREQPFLAVAKGTRDGKAVVAFYAGADPLECLAGLGASLAAGTAKVQEDKWAVQENGSVAPAKSQMRLPGTGAGETQ